MSLDTVYNVIKGYFSCSCSMEKFSEMGEMFIRNKTGQAILIKAELVDSEIIIQKIKVSKKMLGKSELVRDSLVVFSKTISNVREGIKKIKDDFPNRKIVLHHDKKLNMEKILKGFNFYPSGSTWIRDQSKKCSEENKNSQVNEKLPQCDPSVNLEKHDESIVDEQKQISGVVNAENEKIKKTGPVIDNPDREPDNALFEKSEEKEERKSDSKVETVLDKVDHGHGGHKDEKVDDHFIETPGIFSEFIKYGKSKLKSDTITPEECKEFMETKAEQRFVKTYTDHYKKIRKAVEDFNSGNHVKFGNLLKESERFNQKHFIDYNMMYYSRAYTMEKGIVLDKISIVTLILLIADKYRSPLGSYFYVQEDVKSNSEMVYVRRRDDIWVGIKQEFAKIKFYFDSGVVDLLYKICMSKGNEIIAHFVPREIWDDETPIAIGGLYPGFICNEFYMGDECPDFFKFGSNFIRDVGYEARLKFSELLILVSKACNMKRFIQGRTDEFLARKMLYEHWLLSQEEIEAIGNMEKDVVQTVVQSDVKNFFNMTTPVNARKKSWGTILEPHLEDHPILSPKAKARLAGHP